LQRECRKPENRRPTLLGAGHRRARYSTVVRQHGVDVFSASEKTPSHWFAGTSTRGRIDAVPSQRAHARGGACRSASPDLPRGPKIRLDCFRKMAGVRAGAGGAILQPSPRKGVLGTSRNAHPTVTPASPPATVQNRQTASPRPDGSSNLRAIADRPRPASRTEGRSQRRPDRR